MVQRLHAHTSRRTPAQAPRPTPGPSGVGAHALIELQRLLGNRAVQRMLAGGAPPVTIRRKLTITDYDGKKDVVFDQPYSQATKKLMAEIEKTSRLGHGWKTAVLDLIKEGDHTQPTVDALVSELEKNYPAKGTKTKSADHDLKQDYKQQSKKAKTVDGLTKIEAEANQTLLHVGQLTFEALRYHQQQKSDYDTRMKEFKDTLGSEKGYKPDASDDALKSMLLYTDMIQDGVQKLNGHVHGVFMNVSLDNESKDANEGLANTHLSLTGTQNKSAYVAIEKHKGELPLQTVANTSHQLLNALEACRDNGKFMVSQVAKRKALKGGQITTKEAIDPQSHGTFELSGVSGKDRDEYMKRVGKNTKTTVDTLVKADDPWAKGFNEGVQKLNASTTNAEEKFNTFKETSRSLLPIIQEFTGQDTLTPPGTPEYQQAFNTHADWQ